MLQFDNLRPEQVALPSDQPRPRVGVPMLVDIDNARRSTCEWTVSGFVLDKPLPGLNSGDVRTARVVLRITDIDVSFDLPCQVARATEMGAVDFRFLGAFTEQAALLYRITEDYLAGQVTQIDNLLRSSPIRPFGRKRRKLLLAMLVSLLGVSIATLATVLLVWLLTVRSFIGAVSVDGITSRAPATGVIAGDLHPPGSAVRKGQVIFSVVTPDMATKIPELSAELDRLKLESDYSRARLDALKEVTSSVANLAEQRLNEINSKIASLDSQISIYTKLINNRQYLANKGFNSEAGVDEQRRDMETEIQARATARSDLNWVGTQAALAKSGVPSIDWRSDMETPETMRFRIAGAEASIVKVQAMMNAITQSGQITSPCDCVVQANTAKTGEVVESGALISTLRPAGAVPVVVALISANQTAGLTRGNVASVSLVNGRVSGRLEKLSYDDQEAGRLGFFPFAGASTTSAPEPTMVRATISLPDALDASLIGTPALVVIRRNPLSQVVSSLNALVALP